MAGLYPATTSPPLPSLDASALVHMRRRGEPLAASRKTLTQPVDRTPRVTLPTPDTETKPAHAYRQAGGGIRLQILRHPNPANRPAAPANPHLK